MTVAKVRQYITMIGKNDNDVEHGVNPIETCHTFNSIVLECQEAGVCSYLCKSGNQLKSKLSKAKLKC